MEVDGCTLFGTDLLRFSPSNQSLLSHPVGGFDSFIVGCSVLGWSVKYDSWNGEPLRTPYRYGWLSTSPGGAGWDNIEATHLSQSRSALYHRQHGLRQLSRGVHKVSVRSTSGWSARTQAARYRIPGSAAALESLWS